MWLIDYNSQSKYVHSKLTIINYNQNFGKINYVLI